MKEVMDAQETWKNSSTCVCMNLEISRNRDNSTNKTIMHLHQVMTCRGGLVRYMNMK